MSEPAAPQYDVVIVGAGNAALTAALAAWERGAKIAILEKAPKDLRGGNTRFSGGLFRFAYSSLDDIRPFMPGLSNDEAAHIEVGSYTPDQYYDAVMHVTHGEADQQLTRAVTEQSLPTIGWMSRFGLRWEWTSLFNATVGDRRIFNPGSVLQARGKGVGLSAMLFKAVEEHELPLLYDTKFLKLLQDPRGAVRGVQVRGPQGSYDIACRAVVLASGGFEANSAMRARYLGGGWDRAKVRGTKYNTGEGLEAALAIGAKPAGHWRGCHATPIDAGAPAVGDLHLTDLTNRLSYLYGILVNVNARRFVDEGEDLGQYTYARMGASILDQPGSLAYEIFDQKVLDLLEKRYETGTPAVADTIPELAAKLGLDQETLTRTVEQFNDACRPGNFNPAVRDGVATRGIDPPKSNWALPIEVPPFVAYPVTGGITFTFGGLEIDTAGRVIDTEDYPIPGLYATGEITGKFFYHNYPGGAGLMRGAVFGRIAGANAAKEALGR